MHCHYGKNIKFFVEKSLAIIFIDILIGLIKLEKIGILLPHAYFFCSDFFNHIC